MSATLISICEADDIHVDKPIILLGRNDDCDVVLDSKKVSRVHCCIARVKDTLIVRDLASTNGIRVNGQRLNECRLGIGDELSIGNLRYRVTDSEKPRRPMTDSQIEEADEPIPLSDSSEPFGNLDQIAGLDPKYPTSTKKSDSNANRHGDSSWLDIPDNIRLAPSSSGEIKPYKPK